MKRILVIENDPLVRDLVEAVVARSGHAVATAFGGAACLALLDRDRFDLVIAGLEAYGERDGTIAQAIRRRSDAPILGLSAGGAGAGRDRALLAGVLPVPFTVEEMTLAVTAALSAGIGSRR